MSSAGFRSLAPRASVLVAAAAAVVAACGGSDVELTDAAARGRDVAQRAGCAACHGGPSGDATVGPAWVGSWGTDIVLDDGRTVSFDAGYVERAVREPAHERRAGDWLQMPAYGPDQVTDDELDDLVAYLRALGERP